VIIMTSNIGSLHLLEGIGDDGTIPEETRERVLAELRGHFRPEFLNRVDETVLFKPLTLGEIERIVDLLIDDIRRRLAGRRLELELSEPAGIFIAREGYDPVYGARPLRRFIQREVETRVGRALVAGEVEEGGVIVIDVEADQLTIRFRGRSDTDGDTPADAEMVGVAT
jgi:ATP-dependent Clp protease ATP-binding subunit ClpB